MARLENMVAVVTGGAGGIGKATARRFLEEGAKVTIVDISADSLEAVAQDLAEFGGPDRLLTVQADVTKEEDVASYVNRTVEHFGTIDVFFNNAGIEGKIQPLVDISLEDFEKVLAVNVRGVFLGMKHVLPVLTEKNAGSIINMSSNAGLDGTANLGPYVASKHAVAGLTKTAALELEGRRVRVNSIHPSPVNTRMMRSIESGFNAGDSEAARRDFAGRIPLGHYAEAVDVANLVLFLASEESAFITGAQYRVDGGMGATP